MMSNNFETSNAESATRIAPRPIREAPDEHKEKST